MIEEEIRTQLRLRKIVESLKWLYAVVWIEIVVLALAVVAMAWLLLFSVSEIKETLWDNSQLVEIALNGKNQ